MVPRREVGAPVGAPAGAPATADPEAAAVPLARAPPGAAAELPREGAPPGARVVPARPVAAGPEHERPRMRPQRSK